MLTRANVVRFSPFWLALDDKRLFRGEAPIELRPKTFAVLAYLVEHAGLLVSKQALLDAVWPDVAVSHDVLKGCVRELREALGDDSSRPRFVQTAHRLGYRFIAPVIVDELADSPSTLAAPAAPLAGGAVSCVGREAELSRLRTALADARAGIRRCVFLVGDAGSGKTTLLSHFVGEAGVRVLWGQCIDQFGSEEPLLPALEALAQLAQQQLEAGEVLDRVAPRWRPSGEATRRGASSSPSSLLRELADAIDALTPPGGLLLVLEDLHWCDPSTLALLSLLVTRASASPLLVVASFRPTSGDVASPLQSVSRELEQRGRAERLALRGLTEEAVRRLVCDRFSAKRVAPEVAALLSARTGGHPMFVAELAEELRRRGSLRREGDALLPHVALDEIARMVPDGLRSMLQFSLSRLEPAARLILEVVALAAVPLPASAISEIVRREVLAVEQDCERLCEPPRALVREPGDEAIRYAPAHALYRDVVAESVPSERAAQLHRSLAAAIEARPQLAGLEASHVLALHYERSRQLAEAARWLAVAAEHAAERHAPREALALAERGLLLLAGCAADRRAPDLELRLLLASGSARIELEGFGAQSLARTFERAEPLATAIADDRRRAEALLGLRAYHAMRDLERAHRLCADVKALANRLEDPGLLLLAHSALGDNTFCRGQLESAEAHYAMAEQLTEQLLARGAPAERLGIGVNAARKSLSRHVRGYPDQAVASIRAALADPGASADPFQRALVLIYAGFLYLMRREPQVAETYARAALQIAESDGFRYWTAAGHVILGSSVAELGQLELGISHMRHGIELWRAIGALVLYPSFVAELGLALARQGALDDALAQLGDARKVVTDSGEAMLLSELLRLEGEWLMGRDPDRCAHLLGEALAVARAQGARAFELRVLTTRLAYERRAGTEEGRVETRRALAALCASYTEGHELLDLKDAHAALRQHSH